MHYNLGGVLSKLLGYDAHMEPKLYPTLNDIRICELEIAFLIKKNRLLRKAGNNEDCIEYNNNRLREINLRLSKMASVIKRKRFYLVSHSATT